MQHGLQRGLLAAAVGEQLGHREPQRPARAGAQREERIEPRPTQPRPRVPHRQRTARGGQGSEIEDLVADCDAAARRRRPAG